MEQSLLTLDLATATGWCASGPGRELAFGLLRLSKTGDDIGRFLEEYERWLELVCDEWGFDWIVFESPVLPPSRKDPRTGKVQSVTNITTLRKTYGLAAVTELTARRRKIAYAEVHQGTYRKHFIGIGGGRPGKEMKAMAVAMCQALGLDIKDHNVAEAVALHHYTTSKQPSIYTTLPKDLPELEGLFAGRPAA